MKYKVSFPGAIRDRLLRLTTGAISVGLARDLGEALAAIHQRLEEAPLEFGEIQFTLKHRNLPVRLMARRFVSVCYAVDVASKNAMVTKMRMFQNHPFPPDFEEIMNGK